MMNLGIDMFHNSIQLAMMDDEGKTALKKCECPWQELMLDDEQEEEQFTTYLKKIVRVMKEKMGARDVSAGLIIPLNFGYEKRKRVRQLAVQCGLAYVRVGYSSQFAAVAVSEREDRSLKDRIDLICSVREHHIEFGLMEYYRGKIHSLGMMDCLSEIGWAGEKPDSIRRRLESALKQLIQDAGLDGWRDVSRVLLVGQKHSAVEYYLQSITGIVPAAKKFADLKGAAFYAAEIAGEMVPTSLLIGTAPYSLAFAIGEEGEFITCIERNTGLPYRKMVDILVSSEKVLRVYEGNYHNRRFDRIIKSYDLSAAEEGDIVVCYIDYNSLDNVEISVKDSKKQYLIEEDTL